MGFYPMAVVQNYSTTVRQTRPSYTITQNNTHTPNTTMKDMRKQWGHTTPNEYIAKIFQLKLLSKWAHYNLKNG
jgi:hypothetical protein